MKLCVIGLGAAGYPVAVLAAKRGLDVIAFEENLVGGECVNYGCVPTKTLRFYAKAVKLARELLGQNMEATLLLNTLNALLLRPARGSYSFSKLRASR